MPTVYFAIKGKLGDTEYFTLAMKARDVARHGVFIHGRCDEWNAPTVEERHRCDLDYRRIKNHLAPYLANDESRFFGAMIFAAINFDPSNFEPIIKSVGRRFPRAYREHLSTAGLLTLSGGEVLVPLDGRHRLKAIEFAITGRDENGRAIDGITPALEVGEDHIVVMLVAYDPAKARKIFTKVNRYAKPTTKGQNIVTDDDDVVAVITREIANDIIGGRLVKYTGNTLSAKEPEFIPLATLYESVEAIITANFPDGKLDKTQLPPPEKIRLYTDKAREVWETLAEKIDLFADALSEREESGDDKRREIRRDFLLGKPVAQLCLVKAFVRLTNSPTNLDFAEACRRLNKLPWAIGGDGFAEVWDRVLWSGDKVIGRGSRVAVAVRLIAYLCGEKLSDEEKAALRDAYLSEFPEAERKNKQLPKPVV